MPNANVNHSFRGCRVLRLRIARVLLLSFAAATPVACHKDPPHKAKVVVVKSLAELERDAHAARQALAGLTPLVEALNGKVVALRQQFDPLPPGLPGFGETRARFYATAEGIGRMNAKLPWLSSRIDAALNAKDSAELGEISKDIAHSYDEVKMVERIATELGRDVEPFKHVVEDAIATGKSSCE
jgi:hypothetical protein